MLALGIAGIVGFFWLVESSPYRFKPDFKLAAAAMDQLVTPPQKAPPITVFKKAILGTMTRRADVPMAPGTWETDRPLEQVDTIEGYQLIITARADKVQIDRVVVNRGNPRCPDWNDNKYPQTLKFGDQFIYRTPCNFIETTVTVNGTSYAEEWEH